MKSKWKCKICQKVLSTKQNVEKHIDKLHPGCDKTKKQCVEVISNDEIISSNPKKQNKSKSAYCQAQFQFQLASLAEVSLSHNSASDYPPIHPTHPPG